MSQGANAQAVWGFEEVAGVATPGQKAPVLYGVRFKNFHMTPKVTFERVSNIDPRSQQLRARGGKVALPWSTEAEMSVDDIARLRAHMQGFAAITSPAAGVQSWAIRDKLSTDSLTTALDWLSIEVDRDDTYAELLLNAAIDSWDISVAMGKIVNHKISGLACRFTHQKDPVFTVNGATYTGQMYVRNNRYDADALDPLATNSLKAVISTGGLLDGTAQVKFTKGVIAVGTIAYPVFAGVWMPVILADGTYAGDPLDPVEVMWTTGGTFTLADAFTIAAIRPKVTATYPTKNPLIAVSAVVKMGGVAYPVETFDISFKRPRKERRATSAKYPIGLLPDGTRHFAIKVKRDYFDRDFYLKYLSGTPVAFDITINGDFIATVSSVSYFEKYNLTSSNAQIIVAGADVTNEKQLQESIDIVPFWDGTTVELSETIQGTLATLK